MSSAVLDRVARATEAAVIDRVLERRRPQPRDPIAFAAKCGYASLDEWQQQVLAADWTNALLNCSRQAGKSTTSSLLGLEEAIERGTNVLLLAPALRQSTELMRTVKANYATLKERGGTSVPGLVEESVLKMEFENGGRILSLPGRADTIRGFTKVGLLVIDEAAWVPDAVYYAVRPMLAVSGGRILCLSTPFGRRGFFFKEWTEGENWHRAEIPAERCPRIPQGWLAEEKRRIGDWWYAQEYGCQFVDTTDQVFRYEDVQAAYSEDAGLLLDLPRYGAN
jgi:hypothetical protein